MQYSYLISISIRGHGVKLDTGHTDLCTDFIIKKCQGIKNIHFHVVVVYKLWAGDTSVKAVDFLRLTQHAHVCSGI